MRVEAENELRYAGNLAPFNALPRHSHMDVYRITNNIN